MLDRISMTVEGETFSFLGERFGVLFGCWWVTPTVARKIASLFGIGKLPRLGYDMALTASTNGGFSNMITNHSGKYRVTLEGKRYHAEYTGREKARAS